MRKRIAIGMLLLLGVIISLIVFPEMFSTAPKYRGKSAEAWFKHYYSARWNSYADNAAVREEAVEAMRVLSTNALPLLVEKFYSTNDDSPLQVSLNAMCAKLPSLMGIQPFASAKEIREAARYGIFELHPSPEALLPLITNRLYGPDEEQQLAALQLLVSARMGATEVMPLLVAMVNGTNAAQQSTAVSWLQDYGLAALPAVPALATLIENPDSNRAAVGRALELLQLFGPAASNAIPAMQSRFVKSPYSAERFELAATLCAIDPHQPEALAYLMAQAANPKSGERLNAFARLGTLGTNALQAVPMLIDASKEADPMISGSAIQVLFDLGETNRAVSALAGKLDQMSGRERLDNTLLILRHEPTNELVITQLLAMVQGAGWGRVALSELRKLSIVPPPVVLAVRAIATNQNHQFQREAESALRLIEASEVNEHPTR